MNDAKIFKGRSVTNGGMCMANQPKFVIYEDAGGQFRWRLVAGNGEKVAASEAYTRHSTAVNSAYRVKEIANEATVVTIVPENKQN